LTSPHPRLFAKLRTLEARLEYLPADVARCPVCWELKPPEIFTREHIPPKKVHRSTGEGFVPGLSTCEPCNSFAGKNGQDDLKKLVQYQKWSRGKLEDSLPGEMNWSDRGRRLRAEITWRPKLKIKGITKANNKADEDNLLKFPPRAQETFILSGKFHHPKKAAWALLHSAYLLLVAGTDYLYAYSRAGSEIRALLKSQDVPEAQNLCILANEHPIPGQVGVLVLKKPKSLSCYIVKVAGQFIPMPFGDDGIELFERWWRISSVDLQGLILRPKLGEVQISVNVDNEELVQYIPMR
jgi:hypothetical protein